MSGAGDEGLDRGRRQGREQEPVTGGRGWSGWIHVQVGQLRRRDLGDRVEEGTKGTQRCESVGQLGRIALVGDLHRYQRLTAQRIWKLW